MNLSLLSRYIIDCKQFFSVQNCEKLRFNMVLCDFDHNRAHRY